MGIDVLEVLVTTATRGKNLRPARILRKKRICRVLRRLVGLFALSSMKTPAGGFSLPEVTPDRIWF